MSAANSRDKLCFRGQTSRYQCLRLCRPECPMKDLSPYQKRLFRVKAGDMSFDIVEKRLFRGLFAPSCSDINVFRTSLSKPGLPHSPHLSLCKPVRHHVYLVTLSEIFKQLARATVSCPSSRYFLYMFSASVPSAFMPSCLKKYPETRIKKFVARQLPSSSRFQRLLFRTAYLLLLNRRQASARRREHFRQPVALRRRKIEERIVRVKK